MHVPSFNALIKLNFLEEYDFQFIKKAIIEKTWARFRDNGRANGPQEETPFQADEPSNSCKIDEPDFVQVLNSLQVQLPELANELESACSEVEPKFIQLGKKLQAVYADATNLTRHVQDSVNLIGGNEEEGVLLHLHRLAEVSLTRLEGCRKDLSEKAERIKIVHEQLEELSTKFQEVEKVGRFLRIVAVNIGIESVRSEESTELFSVVGSDTAKLSKKIKAVSGRGMEVLKEARDTVRPLYVKLSEGLTEITVMGQKADGIVREAARGIEELITSTLQVAEQVGDHARKVSEQVGNLVVAVQFHDNMSQRVEHITKALGDVESLLIDGAESKPSLALFIMKLQEAQLKEIIDEIGYVYEKGCHSFEEIISGFSTLLNYFSKLSNSAEQDIDRERGLDSFEGLRASFGELNAVLRQGRALMDPVRHAASRASDTVAQVSGLVQDIHTIGFESHLMALNAIIKASRIGSGGGSLEVLAQEVKHSSNQSTLVTERAIELLEVVTDAAKNLRDQITVAEADVALEDSTEKMMLEYNWFMEESAVAHKRAVEIRDAVSKSKESLGFLPLLVERFTASLGRLGEMIRELTPFASEDRSWSRDEVNEVLNRYTIDKERAIHQAAFFGNINKKEQGVAPEALQGSHGSGSQTKDTAGSIELFTDKNAANDRDDDDRISGGHVGEVDEQWDNVELFNSDTGAEANQDCQVKAAVAEETNENEDYFGDNVELF